MPLKTLKLQTLKEVREEAERKGLIPKRKANRSKLAQILNFLGKLFKRR